MQITGFRTVEHSSLPAQRVEQLTPALTLLHDDSGEMLPEVVEFLRDLLASAAGDPLSTSSGWRNASLGVDGELELRDVDGACRLIRETDRSGVSRTRVTWLSGDRFHSHWLASLRGGLSGDLLAELMLPSQDQAIRWRRLEELCRGLEATEAVDPAGLQQATRALALAIRERDGNGVHGGVVHRISELRRRQGELQSALSQLRRPAGDLPARIERLAAEFDARTAALERVGLRLSEIESEIARLEQWLVELRSRNTLPLDRTALESAIQRLTKQQTRFREIRTMIAAESSTVRKGGVASSGSPLSELVTLRALVSRLESRLHLAGTSAGAESGLDPARSELAALCQYLRGHEQAVIEHLEALQSQLCETAMQDLAAVEELLESRLAALRTERDRADNVLAISGDAPVCTFSGHSLLQRTGAMPIGSIRTIAEAEAGLASLRDEQQHLLRQRPELEAARTDLLAQLERLRRELSQAASLEQIDGLRSALAELDAEIAVLEDQRRLLDRSEVSLREVIDRLQAAPSSAVIEIAGAFLMRLSSGALRGVTLTHKGLMVFVAGRGEATDWTLLSDTQREQLALAIRLAAARILRSRSESLPLLVEATVLDGPMPASEIALGLLHDESRQGQQILALTRSSTIEQAARRLAADVRSLKPREVPVVMPAVQPVVLHAWSEPAPEAVQTVIEPLVTTSPVILQQVVIEPPAMPSTTNWLYYLEVDHGVEDLAGITLGELEALRSSGLISVGDLLARSVPELEAVTRQHGFVVPVERLQALRGQSELTVRVPMLRRGDAALLFAAGICTADELSRLRPEAVFDRVTAFQRSDAGSRFRRGGRLIDRQQAINWARFGQCARSLDDARRMRSPFSPRHLAARPESVDGSQAVPEVRTAARRSGERKSGEKASRVRRRRRVDAGTVTAEERRARREARRQQQAGELRAEASGQDSSEVAERSGGLRFFLSPVSEIEKAPSIGPRTARLLEAIGIRTVADLLAMPAERMSEKLNQRRLTASVIQSWQAQSRLMCRIPELRGHDAQILVACGLTSPEGLAAQSASDLYAIVEPFCRTRDGERLLRSGRRPDLAEVTDWIQWAANARALRAA